jgi:hypothetical protein
VNSDDLKGWLWLAALGVGGYFVYKTFFSNQSPVNQAAASVANAYVNLTAPPAPVPQGSVIMPDGSSFPASNLSSMPLTSGAGSLTFQTGGTTYSLAPSNADGNYIATPLSGLGSLRRRRRLR